MTTFERPWVKGAVCASLVLTAVCAVGMMSDQSTAQAQEIPTATITTPADGESFEAGVTITFTGTGTDPEDETLPDSAFVWRSDRDGQIGTGRSFQRYNLSVNTHEITLTVTDSDGYTGVDLVTIRVFSVTLQKSQNVTAYRTYDAGLSRFIVYLKWAELHDSLTAYVHRPDTTGWARGTPDSLLSIPESGGWYTGDIDRTIAFKTSAAGTVGQGSIPITYSIKREDQWGGTINIGAGYTPGSWKSLAFRNFQQFPDSILDLGFQLRFPPGPVDWQGEFIVGLEDFEGYHIWRGIDPDGSDLQVIGEISKEEAHWCAQTSCWMRQGVLHPSVLDLVYLTGFIFEDPFSEETVTVPAILPSLRDTGYYNLGTSFEIVGFACLGNSISTDTLQTNEFIWFDCNAFNGFTYYYLVTPFDRGYNVLSQNQGLKKIDRCQPAEGYPLADTCAAELFAMPIEVTPQDDLKAVYAVPNPFRTGGSRLTTSNYHNFPDDKVRFVNVPQRCTIKIFTVAGDLVWEDEHDGTGGNIEWDARNRAGEDVSSGVYIYRIEDPGGDQVYGRLIIIR